LRAIFYSGLEVSHVRITVLIMVWMLANQAATCGQQGPLVLPEDDTTQQAVDAARTLGPRSWTAAMANDATAV
jgi:predicted small lipoprotein YifL